MDFASFDLILYLRSGYNNILLYYSIFIDFLQNYAWTIIFLSILMYYVYTNYFKHWLQYCFQTYTSYKNKKDEEAYAAKYHKEPDLFSERILMQQQAVQMLQEKYNKDVEEHERKIHQKMEQKRREIEEKVENFGHRLGSNSESEKSRSLKTEYNPLMGPGSSSNYRPPKKSKCGGGGCGK